MLTLDTYTHPLPASGPDSYGTPTLIGLLVVITLIVLVTVLVTRHAARAGRPEGGPEAEPEPIAPDDDLWRTFEAEMRTPAEVH